MLLKCCLFVTYRHHRSVTRHTFCVGVYFLVVFMQSVCHYHSHFHFESSYNFIKTDTLVFLDIFVKVSASGCCLAFAYFFLQIWPGAAYKKVAYKKGVYLKSSRLQKWCS